MKHFCYILSSACAMFWHNLLNRFIFASYIPRRTKIPPGCREDKTKRFNKYPVVVCACVYTCIRARVSGCIGSHRHRSTGRATRCTARLLKRFTAKMPLCKCLIINKIKYFLKFFLVVKERMPNFAIGNGGERPLSQSSLTYESNASRYGCCIRHSRQGDTPETTLYTIRQTLLVGLMRFCFHPLQVARAPGPSLLGMLYRSGSTPEATARFYVKRFNSLHYESNKQNRIRLRSYQEDIRRNV